MATESSEVQLTKCCPPGHLLSGGQGEPLCVDQGDSDLSSDLEIKAYRKSETVEGETASVILRSDQDSKLPSCDHREFHSITRSKSHFYIV